MTFSSPIPSFNMDQAALNRQRKAVGRVDLQLTPRHALVGRALGLRPCRSADRRRDDSPGEHGTAWANRASLRHFTQVLSNRAVNEVKGGATFYERQDSSAVITWMGSEFRVRHAPVLDWGGSVSSALRGFTIGANPLNIIQNTANDSRRLHHVIRLGGRHDVKIGGEYMRFQNDFRWCLRCTGDRCDRGTRRPTSSALPGVERFLHVEPGRPLADHRGCSSALADEHEHLRCHPPSVSGWLQDDWRRGDRLTLNLGVRYDMGHQRPIREVEFRPWLSGDLPHDLNNVAPRLGMNLRLDDRTVLRGGYGLFFAFSPNDGVQQSRSAPKRTFEMEAPRRPCRFRAELVQRSRAASRSGGSRLDWTRRAAPAT